MDEFCLVTGKNVDKAKKPVGARDGFQGVQLLGDTYLADQSSEKMVFFFCFSKYDYI